MGEPVITDVQESESVESKTIQVKNYSSIISKKIDGGNPVSGSKTAWTMERM